MSAKVYPETMVPMHTQPPPPPPDTKPTASTSVARVYNALAPIIRQRVAPAELEITKPPLSPRPPIIEPHTNSNSAGTHRGGRKSRKRRISRKRRVSRKFKKTRRPKRRKQ